MPSDPRDRQQTLASMVPAEERIQTRRQASTRCWETGGNRSWLSKSGTRGLTQSGCS
jgi:hypothetical protein